MAGFKVYTTDDGRVPPCEYFGAEGLVPKMGMALALKEGKLAAASGSALPDYISMTERVTACTAEEVIPVLRVGADIIWETEAAAALTGKKSGDRVQISADGMSVNATAGGAAELVGLAEDPAIGSRVLVRLTRADAA